VELRRVTWPPGSEARRLTVLVLVVSASFGVVLGAADYIFYEFIKWLAEFKF
jgi:preprotein translocase SecE subunit